MRVSAFSRTDEDQEPLEIEDVVTVDVNGPDVAVSWITAAGPERVTVLSHQLWRVVVDASS